MLSRRGASGSEVGSSKALWPMKRARLEICHRNEQKKEEHTTMHRVNENSSAEEINEMQNLKIQRILDRKSGIAEETNYAMKKISGVQQNIIDNLK